MKSFLPPNNQYSYEITKYKSLPFYGAQKHAFEVTVRINATTEESAKLWLQKMMEHSLCTYRHTKGRTLGTTRILYKANMHCKKKPLSQKQESASRRAKNARSLLTHNVR